MKRIILNQIFRAFEKMNRCYEGEGGAPGGTTVEEEEVVVEEVDFDPETYIGDEKINPAQRPLKDFDRTGKTKEDIDKFIKAAGPGIYLTDEGIEKKKAEKEAKDKERKEKEAKGEFEAKAKVVYKKDADSEDQKAVVEKVNEDGTYDIKVGDEVIKNVTKEALGATKAKEDETEVDTDDAEVKAFYEKSGLTPDEFNSLSEKAQNTLFEKVFEESGEADTSLQEEHTQLKADYDTLLENPAIAAIVQDITSGSNFAATKVEPITDTELAKLDGAFDGDKPYDAARKIVQDIFDKRVEKAVKKERSLQEMTHKAKIEMEDGFKVLKEVGNLDKRLAIKETDYKKFKPGHPEYKKGTGLVEFVDYLKERRYSAAQIKKIGAEELLSSFAKNKGWDKERDKTIFKSGKAELLKKIKNPKLLDKAKSLKQGKKKTVPGSLKGASGIDYNTLKQELVEGKTENYLRLLKAHEHNAEARRVLTQIQYDAFSEKEKQKK